MYPNNRVISREDCSLPTSYDALRSVLLCRGPSITWTEVNQALTLEEQQRELSARKLSEGKAEEKTDVQGALRMEQTCHKCGQSEAEPTCYKCGQPGHFKRDCPQQYQRNRGRGRYNPGRGRGTGQQHGARAAESQVWDTYPQEYMFGANFNHTSERRTWIIDSGASRHMTYNKGQIYAYREFKEKEPVTLGDGNKVEAHGTGKVKLIMNSNQSITLQDVLYVPKLSCNLLSVGAAADKGITVDFGQDYCNFKMDDHVIASGTRNNKMYYLDYEAENEANVASNVEGLKLWHQRFGHANQGSLKKMVDKGMVNGISINKQEELGFCEACVEGKEHRDPFPAIGEIRTSQVLDLIHSDVCGPMQTRSLGGAYYFVTFIDDYSRCIKVYCMKSKHEVYDRFKEFEALVVNQTGLTIKRLRTDGGGEYTSRRFQDYLKQKGIGHEVCAPYSLQQNGVAERMNRTLVESARSMIFNAGLSRSFWGEAVTTAAYLRNRTLTSSHGITPYERWYGEKPDVSKLRVFGCIGYALIPGNLRRKWDRKTQKLRFMGYQDQFGSKGYRMYDEQGWRIIVRRDVKFNESDFGKVKQVEPVFYEPEVEREEDEEENSADEGNSTDELKVESEAVDELKMEPGVVRKSSRTTAGVPPKRFDDESLYHHHVAFHSEVTNVPNDMREAMQAEDSDQWKEAADVEYESLIQNKTWSLAELPEGRKAIGSKWVFTKKLTKDGEIDRYKARLVAQGFNQVQGIDYSETFSPTVRMTTVRALLQSAVNNNWFLHQMDVKTAYLNADIDYEVFIKQPEGYEQTGDSGEKLYCRLNKSIYGLKQSGRLWNSVLNDYLIGNGFQKSSVDSCLYLMNSDSHAVRIIVFVDDIIIACDDLSLLSDVKAMLNQRFKMSDLGELTWFLGMEFEREPECIAVNQRMYLTNVLTKHGMGECKPASTPCAEKEIFDDDDDEMAQVPNEVYRSIVGSLVYAMTCTRPDLCWIVSKLSQYLNEPVTKKRWVIIKRVLRYIQGTKNRKLMFKKSPISLVGYCDASWGGPPDRKSITGYAFAMSEGESNTGIISWKSRKQSTIALSSCEAEYVSMAGAIQEGLFLRQLLFDIDVNFDDVPSFVVYCDNQGAIALAQKAQVSERSKHFDVKYHFIRNHVSDGNVQLRYLPTNEMMADCFTKPLGKLLFERFCTLMFGD